VTATAVPAAATTVPSAATTVPTAATTTMTAATTTTSICRRCGDCRHERRRRKSKREASHRNLRNQSLGRRNATHQARRPKPPVHLQ
jgi:hypothetical protein